jgi:hypothetical protein
LRAYLYDSTSWGCYLGEQWTLFQDWQSLRERSSGMKQ